MRCLVVLLSVCVSLTLGDTVAPTHKGCFSTSFVQQYAFYYKLNQSLTIEQCMAACNNRMTRYMGLEVDEGFPQYNHVYCGNDLVEVSPKADSYQCSPCQEYSPFSCGRNGYMSVYLLRDLSPFSLLLATNRGVEILTDNSSTLRVPHANTSSYQTLDYIYTEDVIVSAIVRCLLKSFYNPLAMKYSEHYVYYWQPNYMPNIAVDFITSYLYVGSHTDSILYRTTTKGPFRKSALLPARDTSYPEQISVDPYNRSLVFLEKGVNAINVLLWSGNFYQLSLSHLHVDKINALSMDTHEMLLYAILTFTGNTTTYLVSLDYGVSETRVLFSGAQIEDATVLEVFRDDAVWLKDINGVSTVYQCKLTPTCQIVTERTINQSILDFTIYHPEKQTPGRKRLCAAMNCSHGCQLFSPFTAKCTCPPGMKIDTNNSCVWGRPSTTPTISTYYDESSISALANLSTEDISPSSSEANSSKNNKDLGSEITFYESPIMICVMIISFLPIGIGVLFIKVYKKFKYYPWASEQPLELKNNLNANCEVFLFD